eukprot:352537-Chlamydomonas_euryale.AAC.2
MQEERKGGKGGRRNIPGDGAVKRKSPNVVDARALLKAWLGALPCNSPGAISPCATPPGATTPCATTLGQKPVVQQPPGQKTWCKKPGGNNLWYNNPRATTSAATTAGATILAVSNVTCRT